MTCTHPDHDTTHLTPADAPAHCATCNGNGEIPVEGGYLECDCARRKRIAPHRPAITVLVLWHPEAA